jgi:chromosomal replication initiator protein
MAADALWDRLLRAMQRRIGHQDVEIWLEPVTPLSLDAQRLLLEVPNRYYGEWITENYQDALVEESERILGGRPQVELVFQDDPTSEVARPVASTNSLSGQQRSVGVSSSKHFSNFVVGECNRFAHAAARAVADSPAEGYNPLFIYGATGLGKTHLLHSIGNAIMQRSPDARLVYVTAEAFMNEMIDGLRYKRMEDFRAKYRKRATVLLVDDIQFLSGKDRTQEVFHTFNALQTSGRQIVLSSDVTPKDIDKLEPRLRTRFEGGLLADMQAPDQETLLAILRQKADAMGLGVPPELANAIAHQVSGNIRELEGILNRLSALHSFHDVPLSLEFARKTLPDVFAAEPNDLSVVSIIDAVARYHNVRSADITGTKRTRKLTRPRHMAMFLARVHTGLSFPELGREFGGRDHSTIQHGFRKVQGELDTDVDLAYQVRLIRQSLGIR